MSCLAAACAGLKDGSLKGRRIGVVPASLMGVSSPAAELASRRAVDALRAEGATVVEIPRLAQPPSVEAANASRNSEQEGHQKLTCNFCFYTTVFHRTKILWSRILSC